MSSSAQRDDMTSVGKDEPPKREYEVPTLIDLGPLAELTQSGNGVPGQDAQTSYS
jgi:hypothetical protein